MVRAEHIQAAQNGDREALIYILRIVERDAYKTAYYMLRDEQDARDATQEALLRISRNLHVYEQKAQFNTWVQRIVANLCIDLLRKRQPVVSLDQTEWLIKSDESVEAQVLRDETTRAVKVAIEKLEEPYRSIIIFRYVQQFSYEEIVETMDIPLNTVKSYLFRAKSQLKRHLSAYQDLKGGEKR